MTRLRLPLARLFLGLAVLSLMLSGVPAEAAGTSFGTPSYDCTSKWVTLPYSTDVGITMRFQVTPGTPEYSTGTGIESSNVLFPLRLDDGTYPFVVHTDVGDFPVVLTVSCAKAPGAFTALSPSRVLDTRVSSGGGGPIAPRGVLDLKVTGVGAVPDAVSTVMLNVTVVSPKAAGYLTVFPAGGAAPTASNLNFTAGQVVPNLVLAKVGANGRISFLNGSSGATDVVADLAGFFTAGTVVDPGGTVPVTPSRLMDSRVSMGGSGPLAAGESRKVQATGRAELPATGVLAAIVNVTAVAPTNAGFLTLYASDSAPPATSNVNFTAGQVVPNLAFALVGPDGSFMVMNGSAGRAEVVVDIVGYVMSTGGSIRAAGMYQPWDPSRILDTRQGVPKGTIPGGQAVVQSANEVAHFTPEYISAAVMNVTAVAGPKGGYLTVFPADAPGIPSASNVNFVPGQVVPNLVVSKTSSAGSIEFFNGSAGPTDVVADLFGYFLS